MAIARFRSFVGIAKETTLGTPVAPTDYITPTSVPTAKDTYTKIDNKAWVGSAVDTINIVTGQRHAEFTVDGNLQLPTAGWYLGSLLPDVTETTTYATTLSKGTAGAGSIGAGTYSWAVTVTFTQTGVTGTQESGISNIVTATLGASSSQPLNWTTVTVPTGVTVTGYKVYRFTGTATSAASFVTPALITTIGSAATLTYTDTSASAGAGAPPQAGTFLTSHAFAVKNSANGQPTSLTITDFNGDVARAYAGLKFDDLSLKFAANTLITYAAKAKCWASQSASTPTPSYNTTDPIPAWTGAISINGAQALNVQSGELSIKRNVEVITSIAGVQDPYDMFSGAVSVSGKFTAVWLASDPNYALYATSATTYLPIDINFTQPTTTMGLDLKLSKAAYTMVESKRGKDYVECEITFRGIGNTTDQGSSLGFSGIKATLNNMVAAGTYQ